MRVTRRTFLEGALAGITLPAAPAAATGRSAQGEEGSELHYLTISEASGLLRSRELSPLELTEAILSRIESVEERVGAFITVLADQARSSARRAEEEILGGNYRGPLHGIPVGLKDNEYTQGILTTAASPVLARFVPSYDSTVAARLKSAGAVLIGKTNLPEFSFGGHTPGTHNPWDLSRTAGGSSGGSGAALAAGMLLGATGGDTSGSIRNPAATNGVVGLKPTYGRVSLYGIVPIAWSLDHVGPMTRTVADNAIMLKVLAGHDPRDQKTSRVPVTDYTRALGRGVKGLQLGVPLRDWFDGYNPEVMEAFDRAIQVFERLGASVREVQMPPTTAVINEVHRIVRICEASSYHEQFLRSRADSYGESNVRRDVEAASLIPATQYLRAQKLRRAFLTEMTTLFDQFDIFLTPGRPEPAGDRLPVRQNFRAMFNQIGFPAMALPAGFTSTSPLLPLSLQIAARPFQEEQIYRAAYAYERETRWYEKRPPI